MRRRRTWGRGREAATVRLTAKWFSLSSVQFLVPQIFLTIFQSFAPIRTLRRRLSSLAAQCTNWIESPHYDATLDTLLLSPRAPPPSSCSSFSAAPAACNPFHFKFLAAQLSWDAAARFSIIIHNKSSWQLQHQTCLPRSALRLFSPWQPTRSGNELVHFLRHFRLHLASGNVRFHIGQSSWVVAGEGATLLAEGEVHLLLL